MSDSVGSVSVEVVPDARGWSEKLRAQLRDLTVKLKPELDNTAFAAQLAQMQAEMKSLSGENVDSHGRVDVDTAQANAHLDEVIAKEAEAGRDRTANIKVNTDQRGLSGLSSLNAGLGLLPALALAAGSALVPLTAALGGVALALGAPLAIAAGGATLFAVLGGFAVKNTNDQIKQVDKLSQKLDGLKKGTQAYSDTLKQLRAAQANLSPVQRRFASALDDLKATFAKTFTQGAGARDLLGPITSGMRLLTNLLPSILPLIHATGAAFKVLLDDLAAGAKSAGFKQFVNAVAKQLGPALIAFGRIAGGIAKGVSGIFLKVGETISGPVLGAVEHLTDSFSHAGDSKTLQNFIAYLRQVGPLVAKTLHDMAGALGDIISAAAPIGGVVLKAFDGIAQAIKSIPPKVLTGIVAGLAGFAVVATVIGPVGALVDMIAAIAAAPEVFAVVGAIAAIGVAATIAYGRFKGFRDVIDQMSRSVSTNFIGVWKQLGATWRSDILPTLKQMRPDLITIARALGVLAVVVVRVAAAFEGRYLQSLIRVGGAIFRYVIPAIVRYIATNLRVIAAVARFVGAVGRAAAAVARAASSIVRSGGRIDGGFARAVAAAARAAGSMIASAARMAAGFSRGVATVVRAIGRMASAVGSGVGRAIGVIRTIPGRIKGALGNVGGLLVGAGRAIVQGLISGIKSMIGAAASAAASMAAAAVNAAKSHLHINSPSKVFHGIGEGIGEGLRNGIASTHAAVAGESGRLAASAIAGVGLPPAIAGAGASAASFAPRGAGDSGQAGGDVTLHLYDSDDVFMGTMTGVADERYYANGALAGQGR